MEGSHNDPYRMIYTDPSDHRIIPISSRVPKPSVLGSPKARTLKVRVEGPLTADLMTPTQTCRGGRGTEAGSRRSFTQTVLGAGFEFWD